MKSHEQGWGLIRNVPVRKNYRVPTPLFGIPDNTFKTPGTWVKRISFFKIWLNLGNFIFFPFCSSRLQWQIQERELRFNCNMSTIQFGNNFFLNCRSIQLPNDERCKKYYFRLWYPYATTLGILKTRHNITISTRNF